jgi:predicted phosphodiesterase
MRVAVISDIHGNFEALKRVIKNIEQSKVDKIMCLGDMIGYGPQPEEVVQLIIENQIDCILGNHERALIDDQRLNTFSSNAKTSLEITRNLISEKTVAFIRNLSINHVLDDFLFVHGTPPDSVSTYFDRLSDEEYEHIFQELQQTVAFVGHTHDPICFASAGNIFCHQFLKIGENPLKQGLKYIINVGSVGQPRDGNPNAKYVIFDSERTTVYLRYVDYDIDKTADLILKRGFPEINADRLYYMSI